MWGRRYTYSESFGSSPRKSVEVLLSLSTLLRDTLGSPLPLAEKLENWQSMMAGLDPVKSVLEPAREATGTWLAGKRDPA